jgi:hypothetical protein
MSVSTTALADTLPSSIPKLDPAGTNWTIFLFRFQDAVDAKGFWGHFDGTSVLPTLSTPATDAELAAKAQWEKDERSSKSLLTQKLPDSTLVLIHSKATVKGRWDAVVAEYTLKSEYAKTGLRAKFLGMRCTDKGGVREFLEGLRLKKEELVQAGVDIDEKDYLSVILSSLPPAMSNFASSQLAAARFSALKTITSSDLISMLIEEADRQKAQYASRKGSGKGKEEESEALAAGESWKGKGRKGKGKKDVDCWNCGEKGHFSNKCPKPKVDKKSKASTSTANAAANVSDEEGAWAAVEEVEAADWFCVDEEEAGVEIEGECCEVVRDLGDTSGIALVVQDSTKSGGIAELYDSGCTNHISPYRDHFENFQAIVPRKFRAANQQTFSTIGIGELIIDVPNGDGHFCKLRLSGVQYSPEIAYTLVSIGQLDEAGFSALFGGGKCLIRGPDGEKVGEVKRAERKVYRVEHVEGEANAAEKVLSLERFHRCMGHVSFQTAKSLVKNKYITGVRLEYTPSDHKIFCESCVYAKATRKHIPDVREGKRAVEFGGEVHSDLWRKSPVESKGGKLYYVTFIDDKTRLTHLYLLKKKDETFDAYKKYEAWVETQMSKKVKVLNSDRGGEYLGDEMVAYLKSKGTVQKLNVHDTPQQNGVAERRNRTIAERIRALLHASGLPKNLWAEAARHVVWLLNRTTTKAVEGMTPFEAAFGKKPDLKDVREWGEKVYVRLEKKGLKLGGRVREGRWLGIDEQSKGFRIYWPDTKSITVERNVYYDDTSVPRNEGEQDGVVVTKTDSPSPPNTPVIETPAEEDSSEVENAAPRIRKPTQRVQDLLTGNATWTNRTKAQKVVPGVQLPTPTPPIEADAIDWATNAIDEYALAAETTNSEALEPQSLSEAKSRPDWKLWEKAIEEELETLRAAGTWKLEEAPEGVNVVGSKWVFKAKKDAAGNVVRYKARLVAQGFSQVPGVDYFDTYAPVARLASIRTVLALAAEEDLELGQIDIKGAYLNGELTDDEIIYMRQPPGYAVKGPGGKTLHARLYKSLYGLKQAGRRWYQKLVEIMTKLGFLRSEVDSAVFYRRDKLLKLLLIILVHVDDCSMAGRPKGIIDKFKIEIQKYVEITDLGELHWILGIEVCRIREDKRIMLSQRSYIDSILRRYGFDDTKPVSTPMDTNIRLTSDQSPKTTDEFAKMRNIPYHEAVGSLMYASLGTRPDITFAVQTVSRFSTKPGMVHWEAVRRIFRYLKGTRDLWLTYGSKKRELEGYADADGSMAEDRKAISGYAFLVNGGAVSWSAKRQEIISLSTTESEYVAAVYAAKEALWLRSLISSLFGIDIPTTTLFSDNQSAIALTKEHQYHARTKHIDIRFHFLRWIVEEGRLRLIYCPTDDMIADALTKALPSTKVKHFAAELGLATI